MTRPEGGEVHAVKDSGQALERTGRRSDARRLYEEALHDGTAATACDAAQLIRLVARTYLNEADLSATAECAQVAFAVAEQCGDQAALGHAINILAIVEWKQGNLDDARRLFLQARESADATGECRLSAMIACSLGVIADVRGEEQEARDAYASSLAVAREAVLVDQVIAALCNLGQLETQAGRLGAATAQLIEARELATAIDDRGLLATIELLAARLHVRQDDLTSALESCALVRAIVDQGGAPEPADAEYVFGLVARACGDAKAAEIHFIRAESIAVERQDLIVQAEAARELAELYREQGRNRKTLQRLNQAHRLFEQLHARRELADVDRRTALLESDFLEVARKWGESIESKDGYTQGHCVRVADLACALWTRVNGDDTSLFWFRIGALLHDVGKLTVPAEVLNKPGKLTADEWELMRGHPTAGVMLLADIEFPWDVRPIVQSHHERWDGRGYPQGLAGEAIPLPARVLGVADVYDALTSERSYKQALTRDEALDEMRKDVGTQFEPALFAAFESMLRDDGSASDAPCAGLTLAA
jgi:putative nucleotidyltransferase with HDIG domain